MQLRSVNYVVVRFIISLHYVVVLFRFSYLVTSVSFHVLLHEVVSYSKQIWRPTDEVL